MSGAPLAGIRVLDLTTVVVGPACTLRLADYGAEVIKVETREGDMLRRLGGPSPTGQHGAGFLHLNRNKRTACLDLKAAGGLDALRRIARGCDVFVSNMRPDALARLGLDAAAMRAGRPGLVHCLITGFGAGGPYRGKPAYDSVIQGAAGVAGLFERKEGAPAYVPLLLCDHVTGEIAAGAILAALVERQRTGAGTAIEVPMHETMAAFVLAEHMGGQSFDPPLAAAGDARQLDPGNGPVQTADGWLSLTANTDAQAAAFLRAAGRPELAGDPRFGTVASRLRHVAEWYALRAAIVRTRTTAEWLRLLDEADVPAMPCHTLDTLMDDPHLQAVGLVGRAVHPQEGPVRQLRPTVAFDGATGAPGTPARPVGGDTAWVLAQAGLQPDEVAALLATGAAFQSEPGRTRPQNQREDRA